MEAEQSGDRAQRQQGQQHVIAEAAVGQGEIAGLEEVEPFPQQPQFMPVLVAFGVIEQYAGGQAEHPDQADRRKAAAGLLAAVKEAKESAAHAKDALAAIGAVIGLGKQPRGGKKGARSDSRRQRLLLAELPDAAAHGAEPVSPGGEGIRARDKYIHLSRLDGKRKMRA